MSGNDRADRLFQQQSRLRILKDKKDEEKRKEMEVSLTLEQVEERRLKNLETLQQHLAIACQAEIEHAQLLNEEKKRHGVITSAMLFETNKNQGSKANPSTYFHKEAPAFDKLAAANIHHASR